MSTTSCGGTTNQAAAETMALVEFLICDRALQPAAPTGSDNVPRNAQYCMEFTELVNPETVNFQTISVRTGPNFQSIPGGSFRITGKRVVYDPTLNADGTPQPFGLAAVQQHVIDIPSIDEQPGVIENLDFDPNTETFFTVFTTSSGFLPELVAPQLLEVFFTPEPDAVTGNIPSNGFLNLRFSEAMDPLTFRLGPTGPLDPLSAAGQETLADSNTTLDVRWTDDTINQIALKAFRAVPGSVDFDPSATIYRFRPMFSFGDQKLIFTVQAFQALQDLAGNKILNPASFGPFTADGSGITDGVTLEQGFTPFDNGDQDAVSTVPLTADWGATEDGVLQGQPITSRNAYIMGYQFADPDGAGGNPSGTGQYFPVDSPLIAPDRNMFTPPPNAPTEIGRRVMYTFADTEIGTAGSVTGIAWGPDSNATFAATFEGIQLRIGFQASDSMTLSPQFSGNFAGTPTVVYQGDYQIGQAANIGNTPGEPTFAHQGMYTVGAPCTANWNLPLFAFTGFEPWPALTTFFDWEPGDPAVDLDRVLVFDANVPEEDSFQSIRSWFGTTFPCSGFLINGFAKRRMYAGFGENEPNPPEDLQNGVVNPEPSVSDTCFTLTRRISLAQSLFYGPPISDPAFPNTWEAIGGTTLGANSDYNAAILTPSVQQGGAQVEVRYQGANAVEDDRRTINQGLPFTAWTENVNDCDGFAFIRWEILLRSNLISNVVPRLNSVVIPITD